MRLLRTSRRVPHAGRSFEWISRLTAMPVRLAVVTGAVVILLASLAIGPWFRVRAVLWTGPLQVADEDYARLESKILGQPLFLLSEPELKSSLPQAEHLRLRLERQLPGTIALRLESRRGVACLADGRVVDERGRILVRVPALAGMPRLVGFESTTDGSGLDAAGRSVLRSVLEVLRDPALVPAVVSWDVDSDRLELELAHAGERVSCDASRAGSQLLKLRILARSLGAEPLPDWMDLRFADQVVVRTKGGTHAARRSR